MTMRNNQNNAYYFFYDCILRCVVGKSKWKRLIRQNKPISKLVSASDEAFALLLLLNSWKRWEFIFQHNPPNPRKVKARYTKDQREGNTSFDGWTIAGLLKYNSLIYDVIKDRKENDVFDKVYITSLTQKCLPQWNGKRKLQVLSEDAKQRQQIVLFNGYRESENDYYDRLKKTIENEEEDNQVKQLFQPSPLWTSTTTTVSQASPLSVPSSLVPSASVASMNGGLKQSVISTKTSVDGESKTSDTDTKEVKVKQELIFDENKNKKKCKVRHEAGAIKNRKTRAQTQPVANSLRKRAQYLDR